MKGLSSWDLQENDSNGILELRGRRGYSQILSWRDEVCRLRETIYNNLNGIVPLFGGWQTGDEIHSDVIPFPLRNFHWLQQPWRFLVFYLNLLAPKLSLSLLNIKSYMKPHPTANRSFPKLTMAASLTITFDENKCQVMLQEKQSKHTYKRPASCRSITSLGNSQNTGSTCTPRTIVFGSLAPFPLSVEETTPAKKQKTAPESVAALTPKVVTKKPEARGNPARPQPAKNQVCPKTWSP
ncbi:hypothetical protein AAC387_Pa11g0706 [Persea americana]